LLLGDSKRACEYYDAIIRKGIDLVVFDFSGAIAKTSPFSTLRLARKENGRVGFKESTTSPRSLILDLDYLPKKNSGFRRTEKRLDISPVFKEIYFAYESYQINQATTMSLLSEYCGITDIAMFWRMAKDYEASLEYVSDLEKQHPDILDLPKRCGGVPDEFYQILDYEDEYTLNEPSEEKKILHAMENLNMLASYDVFRRWKLLANKVPKPRKLTPYNFNIEEFRKKYAKG
jgi:hypothetical protein